MGTLLTYTESALKPVITFGLTSGVKVPLVAEKA